MPNIHLLSGLLGRKRPLNILDQLFATYDPITHLPHSIPIGEYDVTPFMSVQDISDHLILLGAFNQLQRSMTDFPRYTGRMAREYQRWAQVILPRRESRRLDRSRSGSADSAGSSSNPLSLAGPSIPRTTSPGPINTDQDVIHGTEDGKFSDEEMPTLGILMCWHAHMLNPVLYAEECEGPYSGLKGKKFPLRQVAEAIENHTLPLEVGYEIGEFSTSPTNTQCSKWDPPDIAAAVQRQMKFVRNLHEVGWLEPGFAEHELICIQKGIVRYHAWLDLMDSTDHQFFLVPTLDLDLAWHTHQLFGSKYQRDCETVLGFFLGHDDQASDRKLGNGMERTAKLWKKRFGYPYHHQLLVDAR